MNNTFKVLDFEESVRLAGGNRKLALELINMLIDQLPLQKSEISESIDANDMNGLQQHVHKLHGSSQCCGTTALMNAANELESVINKNISEKIEPCTTNLMREIDRVLATDISSLK